MKVSHQIAAIVIIILAAISRILPHPPNVTPVTAIALMGGAYLGRKWIVFLVPFLALYLSDFVMNNTLLRSFFPDHSGTVFWADYMIWGYLAFGLIILLGAGLLKKISVGRLVGTTLAASILFFLISNFGVWLSGTMYPKSFSGLLACYGAALPFFRSSLLGNAFFVTILFGAMYALKGMQIIGTNRSTT